MRLIDADKLNDAMYHEAFETDSKFQKWDSGCWIRYKMFENHLDEAPTIKTKQIKYFDEDEKVWKVGEVIVNSSEKPNNCEKDCFLCKWLGEVDVCGRCRNRNLFAEADTEPKPKDEPQTERYCTNCKHN